MPSSSIELKRAEKTIEIGKQLKEQGEVEAAIKQFNNALKLTPDNLPLLNQLSNTYAVQENWEEVVNCCYRILALRPNNAGTFLKLGKALLKQNKLYAAVGAFQQALELDSQSLKAVDYKQLGDLLAQLATSEHQQKLASDAIAVYQKAVELKPDLPAALHITLGDLLQERARFDEAIASYQKAFGLQSNLGAKVYLKLANAQLKQGQLDGAIANYRHALELNSNSVAGHRALGNALEQKGLLDDAIASYKRAIKLKPDVPSLYKLVGDVLTKQGRANDASQYYQKAESL